MTITIEKNEIVSTNGLAKGDRVRLIDVNGDTSCPAVHGDLGTVTVTNHGYSGDLVTVEFDGGSTSVRCDYRFEKVQQITVEDNDSVWSVPEGTILSPVESPHIGILRTTDGFVWHTNDTIHGYKVGVKEFYGTWLPMTVANPEILGEFAPVPEPLAAWEKALLGIFEEGDLVEIAGNPRESQEEGFDATPWAGLRAVVVEANDGRDMVYIRPLTTRPDAYGERPFYWDTSDLNLLDKPYAIGDRVRVVQGDPTSEHGFEGHVTSFNPNRYDDLVVRIVTVPAGRETYIDSELSYRYGNLQLVASARQVEIVKAAEETAEKIRQIEAAEEAERNRVLVAGEQVTRFEQLALLPKGTVVYNDEDPESPMVKTVGTASAPFLRFNRFTNGEGDGLAFKANVYDETNRLRSYVKAGQIHVAYVPA